MDYRYAYTINKPKKSKSRILLWASTTFSAALLGVVVGGLIVYNSINNQPEPVVIEKIVPVETAPVSQVLVDADQISISEVVSDLSPAVVTVVNLQTVPSQNQADLFPVGSGSGVIIERPGDGSYIVTNNHVVEGASALAIVLSNGDEIPVELIGVDRFTDLAVLKTDQLDGPSAVLGNSNLLSPGETVIAIGSPLGTFNNSVTVGVVSALDRSLQGDGGFVIENLVQTDAAINQGNSGGPLLNLNGEIIGINTFIVRAGGPGRANAEGLGFAVPSNTVQAVAEQIIKQGYVSYPFIGISSAWITPPIAEANDLPVSYGVLVRGVAPGGPAAQAGIETGDILTGINDTDFAADKPFINQLFEFEPGETIQVDLLRESRSRTVQVELAERPES
jgi:2-alkenal reductase